LTAEHRERDDGAGLCRGSTAGKRHNRYTSGTSTYLVERRCDVGKTLQPLRHYCKSFIPGSNRLVRPWRRPAVASSLRHGASRLSGDQATDPGTSACDHHARLAELPGHRLPSSAPDSDAPVPGRPASPRDVLGSIVRVRPHRVRIAGMGRA
jgi:hypothetical protein